ncbi:MAG: tetratricopeptide repeat protein [Bacteroidales bacterium]
MAKKTTRAEENIKAVESALGKTEQFIEDNQKPIITVVSIIVLIILAYFGFQRFYLVPQERQAQVEIFMAEKYFGMDSLDLALNGDGINPGFLEIIDEYSFTKTANLAHYYAGVIYMEKGDYESAIDYLEDFDADDKILQPMALGAIGDSYMELGDNQEAADYYMQAANYNLNQFTTPVFLMKAGWAYEIMGEYDKALDAYKKIQEEFPRSAEAREMDKYIARAEGYVNK